MKKGSRRKSNHKRNLTPHQLSRVHKARKKLRKNPAFDQLKNGGPFPPAMIDAACDMAVLQILRTFGVSSRSLLDVLGPIASELLEKHGQPTEIPLGLGLTMTLRKSEEEK